MAKTKDGKKLLPRQETIATEKEVEEALGMLVGDYLAMKKEADNAEPDAERIKTVLRRNQEGFISKNSTPSGR